MLEESYHGSIRSGQKREAIDVDSKRISNKILYSHRRERAIERTRPLKLRSFPSGLHVGNLNYHWFAGLGHHVHRLGVNEDLSLRGSHQHLVISHDWRRSHDGLIGVAAVGRF